MNLKNRTVLVHDAGLFSPIVERLASDFGKVYHYAPPESSFPTHLRSMICKGLPNIEKVDSFAEYKDKVDLIVFPDCGSGELIASLRKEGKRVFGSGRGEKLELDRDWMREQLERLNMPVIPYKRVIGIEALKKELEQSKDKFIKISKYRGLGETKHHVNWKLSEEWFYQKAHILGAWRHKQEFIIEDSVPGVEVGADCFFTNGRYLPLCLNGFEIKDMAYVGKVVNHSQLPEPIRKSDDMLAGLMKSLDVRGSVVMENRITDKGVAYAIDATQRFGSPPGELLTEIWENFSEIVWEVAGNNHLVPMKSTGNYGAQINLYSDWCANEWTAIKFPKSIERFIKIKNHCRIDGVDYFVPQDAGTVIGAAIGIGRTLEEAQINALENAEQVEAEGLHYDRNIFERADHELMKASAIGVGF